MYGALVLEVLPYTNTFTTDRILQLFSRLNCKSAAWNCCDLCPSPTYLNLDLHLYLSLYLHLHLWYILWDVHSRSEKTSRDDGSTTLGTAIPYSKKAVCVCISFTPATGQSPRPPTHPCRAANFS